MEIIIIVSVSAFIVCFFGRNLCIDKCKMAYYNTTAKK